MYYIKIEREKIIKDNKIKKNIMLMINLLIVIIGLSRLTSANDRRGPSGAERFKGSNRER